MCSEVCDVHAAFINDPSHLSLETQRPRLGGESTDAPHTCAPLAGVGFAAHPRYQAEPRWPVATVVSRTDGYLAEV